MRASRSFTPAAGLVGINRSILDSVLDVAMSVQIVHQAVGARSAYRMAAELSLHKLTIADRACISEILQHAPDYHEEHRDGLHFFSQQLSIPLAKSAVDDEHGRRQAISFLRRAVVSDLMAATKDALLSRRRERLAAQQEHPSELPLKKTSLLDFAKSLRGAARKSELSH